MMGKARARAYGLPYQGSKNKIAARLVAAMPPAGTFVDLFAGGCAMTHAAMLSGKYGRFVANDISDAPSLFVDAVNGKYRDECRWISREEFHARKDSDPYVRYCWSFGCDGVTYLYGADRETYVKTVYDMLTAPTVEERRMRFRYVIRALHSYMVHGCGGQLMTWSEEVICLSLCETRDDEEWMERILKDDRYSERSRRRFDAIRGSKSPRLVSLGGLFQVTPIERLNSLRALEGLRGLGGITVLRGDYAEVDLPADAVVYCDPPYEGTTGYNGEGFDHARFREWLRDVGRPVFVSEYQMPDDFVPVYKVRKSVTMQGGGANKAVECLFLHERWAGEYKAGLFGHGEMYG